MHNIVTTIKKELRSIFRDRKTLVTLLIFPVLIPVMIFLYAYMYDSTEDVSSYLIGVNYEVSDMEASFIKEANLEVVYFDKKQEMENAYVDGEIFGYIDYDSREKKYYLYTNEDSEDGMYVSSYVATYLDSYNTYLAKLYLVGEGIDVDRAYSNLKYEVVDLDGENFILQMMFTVSFTYIIMAIVLSTTNMATSATAVEKENGTLETILTFPISVRDLIVGKYLSVVIMGIISSLIGLVLTLGSLFIAKRNFSVFKDISYSFDVSSVLFALLIVVVASFFIAGLSILVTSFAKTYKEAQSMSSSLNMLTVIPMFISLLEVEISTWFYLIPILNYTQLLMDIFSGYVNVIEILMVVVSSVIYVIIVIAYILKCYRTEKVLFSK